MKRTAKIASAVVAASLVAALGAGAAFAQSSNGTDGVARICNGSATCASSQICAGGNGACAGGSCGCTDEDGNGVCDNYGLRIAYVDENGDGVCDGYEECIAENGVCSGNVGGACSGSGNGCGQGSGAGACNGAAVRAGWGHSR